MKEAQELLAKFNFSLYPDYWSTLVKCIVYELEKIHQNLNLNITIPEEPQLLNWHLNHKLLFQILEA